MGVPHVILCDLSAWQYHRTPPAVRAIDIPVEIARSPEPLGLAMRKHELSVRSSSRSCLSSITERLLTDLKGVSLPVHVLVDGASNRTKSEHFVFHRRPDLLPDNAIQDIGGGVGVLTPPFTLALQNQNRGLITVLRAMCEACGIYAIHQETNRTRYVLNTALSEGMLSPGKSRSSRGISAYSDENGKPSSFLGRFNNQLPWVPSFDRFNRLTNLWKRPPLTSTEEIIHAADLIAGTRGTKLSRKAASLAFNGAGSPLETQVALALCLSARYGGEGFPMPSFNRKVSFSADAQTLSKMKCAVADMLWEESHVILEVNGLAYHADRQGFVLSSNRRAALESMGYTVLEIDYEQFSKLEQFDVIVSTFSKALEVRPPNRSARFISQQEKLHANLLKHDVYV